MPEADQHKHPHSHPHRSHTSYSLFKNAKPQFLLAIGLLLSLGIFALITSQYLSSNKGTQTYEGYAQLACSGWSKRCTNCHASPAGSQNCTCAGYEVDFDQCDDADNDGVCEAMFKTQICGWSDSLNSCAMLPPGQDTAVEKACGGSGGGGGGGGVNECYRECYDECNLASNCSGGTQGDECGTDRFGNKKYMCHYCRTICPPSNTPPTVPPPTIPPPTIPPSTPIPTPITCNYDIDIVGLSIDRSSSMNALETDGRTKLAWAKEAASTLVNTLKNSGTTTVKMGVNSFGAQGNDGTGILDSAYNSILHSALVGNFDTVLNAITNVRHIKSGTCIMCGLRLSNRQVNTTDPAKKVAILLSDGKANHNWDGTTAYAKPNAIAEANAGRAMGVQFHVIGFGTGTNIDETTLRSIAGSNGSYQYKPNAQDWSKAFLNILRSVCVPGGGGTVAPTSAVKTPTPASTSRLYPTADTYVSSSSPNANFGSNASIRSNGTQPTAIGYMKFDLTSLAGRTFNKAYLRMYVSNRTAGTLSLKRLTSAWLAQSVTYNTRPSLGTTIRTFSSPATAGTWVSVELTAYISNNKGHPVNFALTSSASSDEFIINSVNASSNKPHILIQ